MRIIAGKWRSRVLETAHDQDTRPSASRTRETLFSMLISRIGNFDDLHVLDLFAGSGAFAFEALSRGAAHADLVESRSEARKAITTNIRRLGADARLIGFEALRLPAAPQPADVIFADPPYGSGLADKALAGLAASGWLAPHSWIAVETGANDMLQVADFEIEAERRVGKAKIWLLRPAPESLSLAIASTD